MFLVGLAFGNYDFNNNYLKQGWVDEARLGILKWDRYILLSSISNLGDPSVGNSQIGINIVGIYGLSFRERSRGVRSAAACVVRRGHRRVTSVRFGCWLRGAGCGADAAEALSRGQSRLSTARRGRSRSIPHDRFHLAGHRAIASLLRPSQCPQSKASLNDRAVVLGCLVSPGYDTMSSKFYGKFWVSFLLKV